MSPSAVAAAHRAGCGAKDLATTTWHGCLRHRPDGNFRFAAADDGGSPSCIVALRAQMLLDGPVAKLIKQDLSPVVPEKR